MRLGSLLEAPLDDRPQRLNRVHLGCVRGHQQQFEVQLLGLLGGLLGLVGGVPIEHDVGLLIGLESLSKLEQESMKGFLTVSELNY